jgi:Mannosyl-glycoprotein endo-beta-N-acetylglucosaminidase
MGRTKHFEAEPNTDFIRQAKRRKSVIPHDSRNPESKVNIDAALMLKHLRTRLWRTLLSLALRIHTLTRGFFKKNGMMKGAILATFAYFLLFSENAWVVERRSSIFEPAAKGRAARTSMSVLNDAAPIAVDELAEAQAREYIERYAPVAKAEMKRYGIPASISLAQGLVESRAGHSTLAKKNNNHFGIKCFSRKCGKGHCSNHTDDTHKDFFRKFKSPWDSWRAHSQMLANGRYVVLKKHGTNYKAWAEGLKELGYATDRKYDAKLIGMIQHYQLDRFDD